MYSKEKKSVKSNVYIFSWDQRLTTIEMDKDFSNDFALEEFLIRIISLFQYLVRLHIS